MKIKSALILLILLLGKIVCWSQPIDSVHLGKDKVWFVTIFDKSKATKDGYYINGYVVNIDHETGQKLDSKKVKISGKVTIVKGLKHDKPGEPIKQGRYEDTKHILKPKIEIIK